MVNEYTERMCCDCVHCDIEHRWCVKRNAPTNPTRLHPHDRQCPDYYELFTAACDGFIGDTYLDKCKLSGLWYKPKH